MKLSIKKGLGFGLTSGIITTLGMMVGLHSSTHSDLVVIGGILIIAVADAMSDALGMHISEESDIKKSNKSIWESTVSTFLFKLIFALTFIIPVLLFNLNLAIMISIIWGLSLIILFSYHLAKQHNIKPYKVILEHLVIAVLVIVATHYIGELVASFV